MDGQIPLCTTPSNEKGIPRINIFTPTATPTQQNQPGTTTTGAASLDLSQLTPVVAAFQEGEVAKARIAHETQLSIAELSTKRQMEVDRDTAARDLRRDRFETHTTVLLFIIYTGMMGYGMWAHNAGFITAGATGFASFLAGRHTSSSKPKA